MCGAAAPRGDPRSGAGSNRRHRVGAWAADAIPASADPDGHASRPGTLSAMREWSEVADAVAATRSTSAKVAAVAAYLRGLSEEELEPATTFLSGRPFPGSDPRTTGLGWRAVSDAVQELAARAAS